MQTFHERENRAFSSTRAGSGTRPLALSSTDRDEWVPGSMSILSESYSSCCSGLCDQGMHSGLGLLEYLLFLEDVGMEPIMAVWSGMCIQMKTSNHL